MLRTTVARAGLLGLGLLASYGAYAALAWKRYGREEEPSAGALLNQFMPDYDVSMRYEAPVATSATRTFDAISRTNLAKSPLVRALFDVRALLLGALPARDSDDLKLLAQLRHLGWSVLAEVPGREIVFGTVTRPWEANVTFRPLPPDEFASFSEPEFVKIVVTLRSDPIDIHSSRFYTETRVSTTDAQARAKFRFYWAWFSPGMELIRWALVRQLQKEVRARV